MAWDDVKNFLGQALGDVSLFLRKPSEWGEIPDVIAQRQLEVAQPAVQQSFIGSPFRAGLLGVGGKDVGGKFQPDLPDATAQNVLQPVHDPQGNPIPGVYMGPDGKLFKGGLTWPEIVNNAKKIDPNFDLSQFEPTGLQGGGIRLQRRSPTGGAIPPPPEGMSPAGARWDPKANNGAGGWIPYARTLGMPKGKAPPPAFDWAGLGIDPSTVPNYEPPPAGDVSTPAAPQGAQTTAPATTNLPTRLNNPGNITASPATRGYPGVSGAETHGSRTFLKFDSLESGFGAMDRLLQSPQYRDLPFEQGMRRWATGTTQPTLTPEGRPVGYDLPAMERNLGIAPDTRIGDLNDTQRAALVREMAKREGFQGGVQPVAARPGGSRLGPSRAPTEGAPAPPAAPPPAAAPGAGTKPLISFDEYLKQNPGTDFSIGPGGVRITRRAPPFARSDEQKWLEENPGKTTEDYRTMRAAEQANAAFAKQQALNQAKEQALTTATRTMVEQAPTVVDLVNKAEKALEKVTTGPLAARYNDIMTHKIGAPNKEWTRYELEVDFLQTALMRMHARSQGSTALLAHFKAMFDAGTQSGENMHEALEVVREYATELGQKKARGAPGAGDDEQAAPPTTQSTAPPTSLDDILQRHGY